MNLRTIRGEVTETFLDGFRCEKAERDAYSEFAYPKHWKMMRFDTERYRIPGYGHFFTMFTDTIFGMKLLTCSFMPGEGASVPYLLIDMMTVGKKRTVFVEYYDCTADHPAMPGLTQIAERYASLADYAEKPAWYVGERTDDSLIKSGRKADDDMLTAMVRDSVAAYRSAVDTACAAAGSAAVGAAVSAAVGASGGVDNRDSAVSLAEQNRRGLIALRERMITEGNPSSSVMNRVFGICV